MDIKKIIAEEIHAINEEILDDVINLLEGVDQNQVQVQQYIDIIDLDPDNPKYNKYIDVLKQKFDVDYVTPEVRNKAEIDVIDNIDGMNIDTVTKKGLPINIKSNKTEGLLTSLTLITTNNNNDVIAHLGFSIDLKIKQLRIGGAKVRDEYQRQGVYTEMIKIVVDVAKQNGLSISEGGRSSDAQEFWKNANLLEGYSSYAEKQEFENQYQQHLKDTNTDVINGELTGQVESSPSSSKSKQDVNVYKNPINLKNFEADVRAVCDDQGNVYVAQLNGDFFHEDLIYLTKARAIEFYRVGNSNMFGVSGTFIRKIRNLGLMDAYENPHDIPPKYIEVLKKLNDRNPDMKFSYLLQPELYGGKFGAQEIDKSIPKTKTQSAPQQRAEYFQEQQNGDTSGYQQNVDTEQQQDPMIISNISIGMK